MKKITIAGAGVAVLGLAVLPITGAYGATSVTDTVAVTIDTSCTLSQTQNVNLTAQNPGTSKTGTATLTISCNDSNNWTLSAVGSGAGSVVTDMVGSVSGTKIATGTSTSGTAGAWNFKLAAGTGAAAGATIDNGYTGYKVIPATATQVAHGGLVSGSTITATYRVYAGTAQTAGTYTGKVTYTMTYGVSS